MTTDQLTSPLSSELIASLVSLAWSTFVGDDAEEVQPSRIDGAVISASIAIGGPWSATVLLFCNRSLALSCAASVLGADPKTLQDEDVHDVMGELANIIGGNLKGIVCDSDEGWSLSLPVVANGMQSVPGSRLAAEVQFRCADSLLGCHVHEHA